MKNAIKVYHFIENYLNKNMTSPTYKEISFGCNVKSKSHVFKIVKYLVTNGYIKKIEKGKRILQLQKDSYSEIKYQIPINFEITYQIPLNLKNTRSYK